MTCPCSLDISGKQPGDKSPGLQFGRFASPEGRKQNSPGRLRCLRNLGVWRGLRLGVWAALAAEQTYSYSYSILGTPRDRWLH